MTVNSTETYQAACIAGLGIIQVPRVGVRDALRTKKLVEILPQYRAEPMPVSLIYPRRNLSVGCMCLWSGLPNSQKLRGLVASYNCSSRLAG